MNVATTGASGPIESAIAKTLERSKRHALPYDRIVKEIARELGSQKEARIAEALRALVADGSVLLLDEGRQGEYYWAANLEQLVGRLLAVVRAHHTKHPYEAGIRPGDLRKELSETGTRNAQRNVDGRLFSAALARCVAAGAVVAGSDGIRLAGFVRRTSANDAGTRALESEFVRYVLERPFQRIDQEKLARHLGVGSRETKAVIAGALAAGRFVEVEENRFFEPATVERVKGEVAAALARSGRMTLAALADALGRSRSSLQPLADHFDRIGFTRRVGDLRELVRDS